MHSRTLAAVAFLVGLVGLAHAAVAAPPPNFVVILADDQGWGTTSVAMDPLVPDSRSDYFRTPNLERVAAAGMRFTEGYAGHCNCSPSRASLQTGRSPAALHLTDIIGRQNGPEYVGDKLVPPHHIAALPADATTIAMLLKAHDPAYRTAHFGKWHLAGGGPARFGYDESDGPTGNREGGQPRNLPDDPKRIFSTTREAIAFLNAQAAAGRPFYLQVSHYGTHAPDQSRPATLRMFQQMPKGRRHANAPYGAMLYDLDVGVGQLLDAVKAAGIADHTFVIYTSDNGSIPTDDPGNINGPVHGYKATVWEGGIRVPLMVVGPGIKAGAVTRTPAVGYDLLPTVCDLAGITAWPANVEGGSLKPVLLGDGTAAVKRPEPYLVFHWPHYQIAKQSTPDSTILSDGWKLHYWWETGHVQLFHLDKDLGESKDLAADDPARAAKLKGLLDGYLAKVRAQLPVPNPAYDPAKDPALHRGKGREDD